MASMNIRLVDVTLRDGLQMESVAVTVSQKLKLFDLLAQCGWNRIEVTSFVNPKWVPQFADAEEFCQALSQKINLPELMAFVPNAKGMERLLVHPIQWAGAFVAVTEAFNKKNVNCTVDESLANLKEVIALGKSKKRKVRVYISTVFGCPYQGKVSEKEALTVVEKVAALGPDEIALSDTIGVAVPSQVKAIVTGAKKSFPTENLALHLHNTYGMAVANIFEALDHGVTMFDGATGGIGGCPYAKGATGNAATDDIAYALHRDRGFAFATEAVQNVLKFLANDLKLKIHSHLGEVISKGGQIYG